MELRRKCIEDYIANAMQKLVQVSEYVFGHVHDREAILTISLDI
jgi:hypothetical protein